MDNVKQARMREMEETVDEGTELVTALTRLQECGLIGEREAGKIRGRLLGHMAKAALARLQVADTPERRVQFSKIHDYMIALNFWNDNLAMTKIAAQDLLTSLREHGGTLGRQVWLLVRSLFSRKIIWIIQRKKLIDELNELGKA